MKTARLVRWVSILAMLGFALMLLPAWIMECASIKRGLTEGEMVANPIGMISRYAFLCVMPLAMIAVFGAFLPRSVLVFTGGFSLLIFITILVAAIAPRNWRANSLPQASDKEALESAIRRIESGSKERWIGRADGRIIWYLKGLGAPANAICFSLLCLFPALAIFLEVVLRRNLNKSDCAREINVTSQKDH